MSAANNVSAGKPKIGGAISVAPLATALPTDASTALTAVFKQLGYVSEEGLSNENSPETDFIKAWGGDIVLTLYSGREDRFVFTLIEVKNIDVLKMIYGDDNVTGTLAAGITISVGADELEGHVIVIDMVLSEDTLKRIVIPDGRVTEVGEIVYSDGEAIGYQTTVTAIPDSNGKTHYEYILKSE